MLIRKNCKRQMQPFGGLLLVSRVLGGEPKSPAAPIPSNSAEVITERTAFGVQPRAPGIMSDPGFDSGLPVRGKA